MKRFYFFYWVILLCLCVEASPAFAQSDEAVYHYLSLREQSSRTRDNGAYWSVSLSGGGTSYWGEKDVANTKSFKNFISPFGKVTVSRWFSSVWGLRLQVDGGAQKNSIIRDEGLGENGQFTFTDGYVTAMTNVMNWGSTKQVQRPIAVYLLGGVGMAWTPARDEAPRQLSPAALLGGQLNIRMTDYWSLGLELDGTIVKDNFNSHTGGRKYEGWATVSIGLVYKFL